MKHRGTGGQTSTGVMPAPLKSKSGNMTGKAKNMKAKQVTSVPKGSVTRGR